MKKGRKKLFQTLKELDEYTEQLEKELVAYKLFANGIEYFPQLFDTGISCSFKELKKIIEQNGREAAKLPNKYHNYEPVREDD